MWNTTKCNRRNTGCILWGLAGSVRRWLVLGRRTGWSTRRPRRGGHQGCAFQKGATNMMSAWSQKVEGWQGVTHEGCPVHCKGIREQCLWVQAPAHVLGEQTGRFSTLCCRWRRSIQSAELLPICFAKGTNSGVPVLTVRDKLTGFLPCCLRRTLPSCCLCSGKQSCKIAS